jgi:arginine repressor
MKFTQREISQKIKRNNQDLILSTISRDFKRCDYLRDNNQKLKLLLTPENKTNMMFKL